jgi:hypothetical protein
LRRVQTFAPQECAELFARQARSLVQHAELLLRAPATRTLRAALPFALSTTHAANRRRIAQPSRQRRLRNPNLLCQRRRRDRFGSHHPPDHACLEAVAVLQGSSLPRPLNNLWKTRAPHGGRCPARRAGHRIAPYRRYASAGAPRSSLRAFRHSCPRRQLP